MLTVGLGLSRLVDWTPFDSLPDELEALVSEVGLTPMQAIQAATGKAAIVLGLDSSLGTLTAGKVADLIAVEGDPSPCLLRPNRAVCARKPASLRFRLALKRTREGPLASYARRRIPRGVLSPLIHERLGAGDEQFVPGSTPAYAGSVTNRAYNLSMGQDLASERCLPCEQGTLPLQLEEALALLRETDGKWHLSEDGRALTREITFKTFGRAMAFLNRLAEIAERAGHHPDFCLSRWNQISLSLTTHAIGGLSRNDFILAAKLQAVIRPPAAT